MHCQIHAAEVGPHSHIRPLDIQPAGGLRGRRRLPALAAEPPTNEERPLFLGRRIVTKMLAPLPRNRVRLQNIRTDGRRVEHAIEAGYVATLLAHNAKDSWIAPPPFG